MGKELIGQIASAAQAGFTKYGILASVTIAQAAIESTWGTSIAYTTDNNMFGIKVPGVHNPSLNISTGTEATDDGGNYAHYDSWEDSVDDHGYFLRNNSIYSQAIGLKDAAKQARVIADAGYASGAGYYDFIMSVINDNNLTQYDTGTYSDSTDITDNVVKWKQGWNEDSKGWFYVTDVAAKSYYTAGDGWKEIEGCWYRFNSSGYALQNAWFQDTDTKWYFFDKDCKMISSTWVFDIDTNKWYHMDSKGAMETIKWFQYKNFWYYLKDTGEMASKEWFSYKNKWYYLNEDGKMAKSQWVNHNNVQYYMNADGIMVANTTIDIEGKSCTFNENGVLVNSK